MATRKGVIKKSKLSSFSHPRVGGIIAQGIDKDDELIAAGISNGKQTIFLGSYKGLAIHFNEKDVRPMGRTAGGVRGIKLGKDDYVVDMVVVEGEGQILTLTERGCGKRTDVKQYRLQGRGGKGLINLKVAKRNGHVIGVKQVDDSTQIMVITKHGKVIRTQVKSIRTVGRASQGLRVIKIDDDDNAVAVAKLAEDKSD